MQTQINLRLTDLKIAVIGLGYVGLPLAVELAKKREVVGFDINSTRIDELLSGIDRSAEVSSDELTKSSNLRLSSSIESLAWANCFIITVPTPIDKNKRPDLSALEKASESVGKFLTKQSLVIYESTVYPGCTEDICIPILEAFSNLTYNVDFFCGYSPERANPGDKTHKLSQITKIVSGSNEGTLELVDQLYKTAIEAGTYRAPSIKIAEAAKVIENTQRDVNIALINEFALIFEKLGLCTKNVLDAAGSKWNFLPFKPGLVGGHCIGVDPYYLTHKAQSMGYHPELLLAGRRLNDTMHEHIANRLVKSLARSGFEIVGAKILFLGVTFKENCPDIRNTKVLDLAMELNSFNCEICYYDPWISKQEDLSNWPGSFLSEVPEKVFDAVVLSVPHDEIVLLGPSKIREFLKVGGVFFDVKTAFDPMYSDLNL